MQIKVFSVPIFGGEAFNEELNAFLRGHKVLQIDQQLVNGPDGSHWTFCVRYAGEQGKSFGTGNNEYKDYKELLSEEVFERFSKYRAIRKEISEREGVPAFAIFTNKELAKLADLEELTLAGMQAIKGIGSGKMEKYADLFIKAASDEKRE